MYYFAVATTLTTSNNSYSYVLARVCTSTRFCLIHDTSGTTAVRIHTGTVTTAAAAATRATLAAATMQQQCRLLHPRRERGLTTNRQHADWCRGRTNKTAARRAINSAGSKPAHPSPPSLLCRLFLSRCLILNNLHRHKRYRMHDALVPSLPPPIAIEIFLARLSHFGNGLVLSDLIFLRSSFFFFCLSFVFFWREKNQGALRRGSSLVMAAAAAAVVLVVRRGERWKFSSSAIHW